MGTRADFYVGIGPDSEWLGSIAWGGYIADIPDEITGAMSEVAYRENVAKFLDDRDDGTTPDMGWPWQWDDSHTTLQAFTFHSVDGFEELYATSGRYWIPARVYEKTIEEDGDTGGPATASIGIPAEFPDMSDFSNPAIGTARDSTIVIK